MKLTPDMVMFDDVYVLRDFVRELNFSDQLQFARAIEDNNGKILVEKGILVKKATLDTLESMVGLYKADFQIPVNAELLLAMQSFLGREIGRHVVRSANAFSRHILERSTTPYKALIRAALKPGPLLLALYRARAQTPALFEHLVSLALLSLAIVIQTDSGAGQIRSKAFLAGLVCDLAYMTRGPWTYASRQSVDPGQLARDSARLAAGLGLPAEVSTAIAEYPGRLQKPANEQSSGPNLFDESTDASAPHNADAAIDPEVQTKLSDALVLAHYILDASEQLRQKMDPAADLIGALSYNTVRGLLPETLATGIINCFSEYEYIATNMRQIGLLEQKCLRGDQALAYARPNPSQILCIGNHYDCPNCIQGWEMNVIAPDSSAIWLGQTLRKGTYAKCRLEEELALLSWA
ncbi:MAG: hypothetical protein KDK39_16345 [Leptospiraceae bacterium]|nr:hypothetical protein [Leptospiraceae bacterium]